jgi:hypothetical protein
MGIKEEEVQAKGICNIVNEIISENFANLKKVMPIQVQEGSRPKNRHEQNRTSPPHIIVKIISTENMKRILKTVTEKNQITYKGKSIQITTDFSTENLKATRAWSEIF